VNSKITIGISDPAAPSVWDDKHPKAPVIYAGRPLPGQAAGGVLEMDVRRFIWPPGDVILEKLLASGYDPYLRAAKECMEKGDVDNAAWMVQKFAVAALRYVADETIGSPEFWLFPGETLGLRRGDCEDGAILIVSMCRAIGIPSWRIRVAAGMVDPGRGAAQGGHAWATFLRSDSEWVALDWCYYEDSETQMNQKSPINHRAEYFAGTQVWFSFNDENAWSHERAVQIRGRVRAGSV